MNKIVVLFNLFLLSSAYSISIHAESLLVQSTTSTANSGFYAYLAPILENDTGIELNVVAVGTGQAIKNAKNCDADVLLVHAKEAENTFVSEGHGIKRHDLMYNDFVIVGPVTDPANIKGSNDATFALATIANSESLFASRGDDSGTHKKELGLWSEAGVSAEKASGQWYRSTGSGMGATLNTAIGMSAYTLTDRATWISYKNKSDFEIVAEGDTNLFNQYGVILVNAQKCKSVKAEAGQKFIDWLISEKGQNAIAEFQVNGQQLFFPNANNTDM